MSESFSYETLLAEYSCREGAIELLRQYRPYLELIPSMRRPEHSLITIPLPLVRIRRPEATPARETVRLPCDLAIVMCDPEWKIKLGSEILIFIHRPNEDFSDLLKRWRECQLYLDQEYEWLMPPREQHMFSEGAEEVHPLFVVLDRTPDRIKRGLAGACLPMVVRSSTVSFADEALELVDRE
ncbi:hypothetical protein V0288_17240 [Pannus brasiliensis CCIBt3594]|uniref:Type IV pilin PilA n=1 Tax=Pannus brasiliensis CCIBt3594 TaxID=1427578 RepID=A0AAW9QZ08_9CHRO